MCDGALAVRNPTIGHKTTLEWTTDFLRDRVWGGERIATMVKETLYTDAELVTAELEGQTVARRAGPAGPAPARTPGDVEGRLVRPGDLALPVDGAADGLLAVGEWYRVHGAPGVWASVVAPRFVDASGLGAGTNPLDAVETSALVYTVAFDLDDFEVGYELGTEHPRVDWSGRVPVSVVDPAVPGPDGFGGVEPLVRTGLLDPAFLQREVAVLVGGFKRAHGAFANGDLAARNSGSHYGFVQYGTEISHLQPGLATVVVWSDQSVELKTWSEADASSLWRVRHARQNGVPLLERDEEGFVRAGALVSSWSKGNWSGSVEGNQRSVRSGMAIQDSPSGRYLLYSYFSSATPSAMATVYWAYGCEYAMLLDMNALEHTYLAVRDGSEPRHLVHGMEVLDLDRRGGQYQRFVGYADNRDFFYILRRP